MAEFDPRRTPGQFGAIPDGAPREISSKEIPNASLRAMEAAREDARQLAIDRAILAGEDPSAITLPPADEQELAPFAPKPMSRAQMEAMLGKAKVLELLGPDPAIAGVPIVVRPEVPKGQIILTDAVPVVPVVPAVAGGRRRVAPPGQAAAVVTEVAVPVATPPPPVVEPVVEPVVLAPADVVPEPDIDPEMFAEASALLDAVPDQLPPPVPPPLPHQRAASNSDSPSRGIPTAVADLGKQITGGFGDLGDAQYFPLNGDEVRVLAERLLDELHARIQDDIRFSIAAVYPRITMRVAIEVTAVAANDHGFVCEKIMPEHKKTPIDVARAHGEDVVFVVSAERQEMTPEGESIQPSNAIRQEIGVQVPRKRVIQTAVGRRYVDVV